MTQTIRLGNMLSPDIDILRERNTLGSALLEATASLAQGESPRDILQSVCQSLVNASAHIRLAWMIPDNLHAQTLKPVFATGPARDYAQNLIFTTLQTKGPLMKAIESWEPVTGNLATDSVFNEVRESALENDLRSTLCLPVGRKGSRFEGLVAIYADVHDYFNVIGLDLFVAFAHVVGASMEQAALLNDLSYMASHDQLTDILNRRGLQERLRAELSLAKRYQRNFSIITFDIDRFKLINDGMGHHAGDRALGHITHLLTKQMRDEDVLGRWGGEEFLCILPETDHEGAGQFAERLRETVANSPLEMGHSRVFITASFGYATYPADGDTIDTLLASADAALYQAKYTGRNRSIGASGDYLRIHAIGNQLDQALRDNRVVPAFQPIVDLKTGKVVAKETLARMRSLDGDLIEAGHFIEAANRLQLIHRIDQTIVQQAFNHCVESIANGEKGIRHFVNISADLLRHDYLVEAMLQQAREHCEDCDVEPAKMKPIVIEITERELLHNLGAVHELLRPFIDFGFTLALDDFGSGYSSYQYLVDLPIQIIKIDGELIRRLPDARAHAVIQGIQDTANSLDITTVAEFVEDEQTADILRSIGIDWAQGFYYGHPQTH
ncbi:MAG: GGDEF domain-containing protein [Gammaproteobacteria bacterium]|nr:GGDEF domain-containing protein [Gammaproteobacteria bacterium]